MKRAQKTFAAAARGAAALAIVASAALKAQYLGFENGVEDWTPRPEGSTCALAAEEAASIGKFGLRVTIPPHPSQNDITGPKTDVRSGSTYQVTFWTSAADSSPAMVSAEMIFFDETGKELPPGPSPQGKRSRTGVPWSPGWSPAQLAATAPENAKTLAVRLKPANGAAGSSVYFDDFSISEYLPATTGTDADRIKFLEEEIRANPSRGKVPPKIVLKLDDLKPANGGVSPKWIRVADFAKEKNIKLAIGIIADGLQADGIDPFVNWIKEQHAANRVEFWNHGWDHSAGEKQIREFSGQPYEFQKDHLVRSAQIAKEKLGFPFASFGAPFNATDAATAKVLSEDPDIKVWIYGDAKNPAGKTVLLRNAVTIETNMKPDFGAFLEAYAHNRGNEYFVMQGHAGGWDDAAFEQFAKIVGFLLEQKAEFVFPRDFASSAPQS